MDIYKANFNKKNKHKILSTTNICVILLLILILLRPGFVFSALFPSYYKVVTVLFGIILSGILFFKNTIKFSYFFLFFILINLLYFCFLLLDPINYIQTFGYIFKVITVGLIYLFIVNVLKNINYINFYVKFMAFLSLINTTGYLLMSLNLLKPFSEFQTFFSHDQDQFYNYGFFFVQKKLFTELTGFNLSRTCGYFDEPGTFGFYLTIALILYHLFFPKTAKNKVIELILLITGLTTFSLAFYISIAVFYSFLFFDAKRISNVASFLKKEQLWAYLLIFMLAIAIYRISNNEVFWGYFHEEILGRLELTEGEEVFAGNNRASGFSVGLPLFWQKIWFGWGPGYSLEYFRGKFGFASLAGPLVKYGLIGTLIVHLPFFRVVLQFLCSLKKDFVGAGIVLILNFAQRPHNFGNPSILLSLLFIIDYYFSKKGKLSERLRS